MNVDTSPVDRFLYRLAWPLRALQRLFFRTISFSAIMFVALGVLIWWGGPLVAFADHRPLESERARIVFIVSLVVLYILYRVIKAMRTRSKSEGLLRALSSGATSAAATPEGAAAAGKPAGRAAETSAVQERFQSAVEVLRSAQFGAQPSLLARLVGVGSRRYLYQMPWYMFVGAPGAGKTTALLNSGLKFPLADKLGQDPLRGVAGTRHCDWWITDQAVMIDTAGRYTSQDSDQASDSAEWNQFLTLLQKYRPRQPINGVLVTVSAADLLMLAPADRERQAHNVRARLHELMTTLAHDFPVYLIVSKSDLVAGFSEYFETLDRTEREQVWGFTLPFVAGARGGTDSTAITKELDTLSLRLVNLTFERLHQERDLNKRALIYGLPYQFQSLREPLAEFIDRAFSATKLIRAPMVRGVYFTSGTQEGSPIDRIIGSIARGFGLQRQMLAPLRPSGRAYFLKQLLHEVVFPEAVIAGTNLRWERRARWLKWGVAVGSAAIALFCLTGLTLSYFTNRGYVDEVGAKTQVLKDSIAKGEAERRDVRALLPVYSAVLDLPRTPAVVPENPGFWQGFGLFQGRKLLEASEQSYQRMLRDTFAPQIAARIAQVLKQGTSGPEIQYETLKAYLMLYTPDRMNANAFKGWVAFDLETALGSSFSAEERSAILSHVDGLLSRNVLQGSLGHDEKLVAEVRAAQLSVPFPQRVYERLKRQGAGPDISEFRIPNAGGPSSALVFARVSGKPLSEGVPALYTYDGYHKGFTKALDESIRTLAEEETWVLGVKDSENARRAKDIKGRETLTNEVKRLYLVQYGDIWEKFIADITVRRSASLAETLQTVRLISANDSPLTRLMRAIAREVTLAEKFDPVRAVMDRVQEGVQDAAQKLKGMMGGAQRGPAPLTPVNASIELLVDDRFSELRNLVRAPAQGQAAPIEANIALMNDLYQHMVAADSAAKQNMPPPAGDVLDRVRGAAPRMPEPVKSIMNTLGTTGAGQSMDATRENLTKNLRVAVTEFCAKAIVDRYPFVRASSRDVTADDFARLFGPSGVMDEFFQKQLVQYVDVGAKPWRYRRIGETARGDGGGLAQFQRAAEIRGVFFGGGARAPSTRVDMKPIEMDPALESVTLDAGGQVITHSASSPGAPRSIQWPSPQGVNQVRLQATAGGAAGTPLLFEGPWALFRMFDRGTIEPTGSPDRFRVTFQIDGKSMRYEVTASSVQNPFRLNEMQAFRCPATL